MVGSESIVEAGRPRLGLSRVATTRWWFLQLLVIGGIAVLLGRSFYLQIWQGTRWHTAAEDNRIVAVTLPAPRGIIYSQHGEQLVANVASTDVFFDPTQLPRTENESSLIERLPGLLDITPSTVQGLLRQTRVAQQPTRIVGALPHETVLAVEQELASLPGVYLASTLVRDYIQPEELAHVLGYTSAVTAEEIASRSELLPIDSTGKSGLEFQYDSILRGRHGVRYQESDASGRTQKQLEEHLPVAGADLHTTIDLGLQTYLHHAFREWRSETDEPLGGGAAVALDPRTGAVRALASWPAYNPNVFSQPAESAAAGSVINAPGQPLFNRAIAGSYPPGSTIKPLIAAAALEEQIISSATVFPSTGGITIGPWHFPDWKVGGHGNTDVAKAIAESVNTFFYRITGGQEGAIGLGVTRAVEYLATFGWGTHTGVDLPEEASGFLPSPQWKEAFKNEPWYIGDTYHLGIGQGDVLATPLQVAVATAVVANGGILHQPFVVEEQVLPSGELQAMPRRSNRVDVTSRHLATVRNAMRETISSATGSGRRLATLPLPLAGKTGTAQIGGTEDTHAWFSSFGPYDEPELVVVVVLERGGAGDKVAVPFTEGIWQWWLEHRAADRVKPE